MEIARIIIYDEPKEGELKAGKNADWLRSVLGAMVEVRRDLFGDPTHETARRLSSVRILDPGIPLEPRGPAPEEIGYEATGSRNGLAYYDGFEMQRIARDLIDDDELDAANLHIVFTSRLTCTYDERDLRYHGRVLIGSNPSLISTTGAVEAPAKPREYYTAILSNITRGLNLAPIARRHAGRSLTYHDARLQTVMQGYILQAVFYHATGEAFCNNSGCRLYNAHWQKDMLHAQIESGKLCPRHSKILNDLNCCRGSSGS